MAESKKKPAKKPAKSNTLQSQLAFRRQMWGVGYIIFAFLLLLALFNIDGFVLSFLRKIISGLIGMGFYLLPPALLSGGITLIRKKKGKARRTVTLMMLLPLIFGMIGHIFTAGKSIPLSDFKVFYETGTVCKSGGIISGYLASLLSMAISTIGAGVLTVLLFLFVFVLAFNINLEKLWGKARELPGKIRFPEEPDEPEAEYIDDTPPAPPKGKKRPIDIALDGEQRDKPKRGEKIDIAPPNVMTPAEILANQGKKGVEAPPPEDDYDPIDDFQSDDVPKQTDGLMLASEENDGIIHSLKEKVENLLPWGKKEEKEPEIVRSIDDEQPSSPDIHSEELEPLPWEVLGDTPLHDRDDAVQSRHDGPIEIPPPVAAPTNIGPSITGKPTKLELAESNEAVASEIEAVIQRHNEDDIKEYLYPPVSLLKRGAPPSEDAEKETRILADRLVDTLLSFGIDTNIVGITRGPTVTRYELTLQRGIKFSRVSNLSEDIALSLGAPSIRISTIPDKQAIGIEVPNATQQTVHIRDIIDSGEFRGHKSKICFSVGKDIAGKNVIGDIARMPHMLIAGTTGSGKSVCINSILISLLYKASPEEVRLIMIDPKMIELGMYNGIPHLLIPVVTDPKKASGALNWAVSEMMRRYKLMQDMEVRDLASYNDEIRLRGEGEVLPQIVIVIDELADLMFVAAKEVEDAITRIAQMARAAGMHLIIATQRPSADVITGLMKSNIPSRIAFAVASQIESRIILDTMGAEKLIGKGDMLFDPMDASKPMRVQGCFVTTNEVESVIEFIKKTSVSDYKNDIIEHIEHAAENTGNTAAGMEDDDDPLMNDAISIVVETGQASTSMLQRRLKLGYSRASRLIDQMEVRGIVGPFEGSKPRQVLISKQDWQEMVLRKNM